MRQWALTHKDLARKIAALEGKIKSHDRNIRTIFEALRYRNPSRSYYAPDLRKAFDYLKPEVARVARREYNAEQDPQWRQGR